MTGHVAISTTTPWLSALLLIWMLASDTARAEEAATDVCLKNGTLVRASKIESKDSTYILSAVGGAQIEVPANSVKSFGVPCETVAPPATAPDGALSHFGVYGSNTIGERLMPMLIDAFARAKLGNPAKFVPGAQEQQEIHLFQGTNSEPVATIDFRAQGSATAFPALLESRAAIGMASRSAKPAEAKAVENKYGIALESAGSTHVLALDGVAVIVNAKNPIQSLDLDTIAKIFLARSPTGHR